MKKLLLSILILLIFPFVINAAEVNIASLGLTITLPDTYTYVTRDNVYHVDSTGFGFETSTKLLTHLRRNSAYLMAYDDNIEFYIKAVQNENNALESYTLAKDLSNDVVGIARVIGATSYNIVKTHQIQLISYMYTDSTLEKTIVEYYTTYNDIIFTITIQPKGDYEITNDDYKSYDEIIETIELTGEGQADVKVVDEDGLDKIDNSFKLTKNSVIIILCIIALIITLIWAKRR